MTRSRKHMEERARSATKRHYEDKNGAKYDGVSAPSIDQHLSLDQLRGRLHYIRQRLRTALNHQSAVESIARSDFLPLEWHKESGAISASIKVQELQAEVDAIVDRVEDLKRYNSQ